ncbi:MAG: hypothetical protein LKM45_05965, partial [Wolbachia endosymbiont of Alcedoecus sp.]|nr:hypothetical protein [Wolbachia endosymbiont of Alcedoecus sp.]
MVGEESSVVEAEEISRQPGNLGIDESIVGVACEVSKAIYFLSMYPSEDVKDYAEEIASLISLKSYVSEEESPSTENLAIMKFLHLIIHNKELQEKLKNLDDFIKGLDGISGFTNGKESYSQLCEVVTNFKLLNLSYKIDSLLYIKEKKDFTTLGSVNKILEKPYERTNE